MKITPRNRAKVKEITLDHGRTSMKTIGARSASPGQYKVPIASTYKETCHNGPSGYPDQNTRVGNVK